MKKLSIKIIAIVMMLVMTCSFQLTACSGLRFDHPEDVDPDTTIEAPDGSGSKQEAPELDTGDGESITPPAIPDESTGVKIVLPENVDSEILSYAYASISLDLMSYGYEVFNGYVKTEQGNEFGIAYTDYEEAIVFENDDKVYLSTGFLGFSADESVSEADDLLFVQPVNESAEDIVDESYGYVLACVEEGIPSGHFVANGKYVKYSVNDGKVEIKAIENKPENYDLSLGTLYDYDKQDIVYVPFDEIDSSPIGYVPLTEDIDYKAIKNNLYNVIEEQQANGYTIQTITISFVSSVKFSPAKFSIGISESK